MKFQYISPVVLSAINYGVMAPIGIIYMRTKIMTWDYVLIAIGIALAVNFAVTHIRVHRYSQAHVMPQRVDELVTGGPFRYVRHPLYSSFIGMNLAYICFFRTLYLIPAVAVFITLWYFEARYEEGELLKKFGRQYKEYRERTWMFLPKLK